MRDYIPVHLLAPKEKVETIPHLTNDLSRSVLVQCAEQEPYGMAGYHVGVLVYLRQDGHLVPGKLNPLLYVATITYLVEQLSVQALNVGLGSEGGPTSYGEPPRRRKGD